MPEADDRLAGDPVWELFPALEDDSRLRHSRTSLLLLALALSYWIPTASVILACVAASFREFWEGRRLSRSIPGKAGGRICSLFTYAWGAWKLGVTAFLLMFVVIGVYAASKEKPEVPAGAFATMLLWFIGFTASAALTATGLLMAFRSGMRVWIGEGVNEARLLLGAMLIVAFAFLVLGPLCVSLIGAAPSARDGESNVHRTLIAFGCVLVGGPIPILITLDRISRHVVADTPGKFGPKVPTVGKWDIDDTL
jgi:hypothetical protein